MSKQFDDLSVYRLVGLLEEMDAGERKKWIEENKARLDHKDSFGTMLTSTLYWGWETGNEKYKAMARELIEAGADLLLPGRPDFTEFTPLELIIKFGLTEFVPLVIENLRKKGETKKEEVGNLNVPLQASVQEQEEENKQRQEAENTPLQLAFKGLKVALNDKSKSAIDTAKLLIESLIKEKANLYYVNTKGNILHLAVELNSADMMKWLFNIKEFKELMDSDPERMKKLLNERDAEGNTPLMKALDISGDETLPLLLLNAGGNTGADIKTVREDGYGPLHAAIRMIGFESVVRILLKSGANVNQNSTKQYGEGRPLKFAIDYGHENIAIDLLDAGADINLVNLALKDDQNILHLLTMHRPMRAFVSLLQIKHPKIFQDMLNAKDNDGHTPLTLAIAYGRSDIAQIFINAGARTDIPGPDNKSCLSIAYSLEASQMRADDRTRPMLPIFPLLLKELKMEESKIDVRVPDALRGSTSYNEASKLIYIHQNVPDFMKECFNQNDIKRLAECIEILYLREKSQDPFLYNRQDLNKFIDEKLELVKDLYFNKHFRKLKEAEDIMKEATQDKDFDIKPFMKKMLRLHIAHLLPERSEEQLLQASAEAVGYEEQITLPTLPIGVAEIMDDYMADLERTQPSEQSNEFEQALLNANFHDLERLLRQERQQVFARLKIHPIAPSAGEEPKAEAKEAASIPTRYKEHGPLVPLYKKAKTTAIEREQAKAQSLKASDSENTGRPKPGGNRDDENL